MARPQHYDSLIDFGESAPTSSAARSVTAANIASRSKEPAVLAPSSSSPAAGTARRQEVTTAGVHQAALLSDEDVAGPVQPGAGARLVLSLTNDSDDEMIDLSSETNPFADPRPALGGNSTGGQNQASSSEHHSRGERLWAKKCKLWKGSFKNDTKLSEKFLKMTEL